MIQKKKSKGLSFAQRKKGIDISIIRKISIWVVEIIIVIVIAATLSYFVGLQSSVVGKSMAPTLDAGDEILINRFSYKLTDPKTNDLIVFLPNGNEKSHYYIKRVIAVPGETVQIKDGQVYVNGKPFEEEIEVDPIENAELAAEEILLENDEYFVLGDNRNNSEDSRYANIGNVKSEHIIGKAWFCISPGNKIGKIK
ncbi:MAG: signal peptidase I [Eubacterium sp.]|jgi:signal peptidase I, bacterial type|nr:signal peptidase I [Eubacterium sp.]